MSEQLNVPTNGKIVENVQQHSNNIVIKDNEMKILVKLKSNYGKEVIYPVCDSAKAFAAIAGTTTLTKNAIKYIKALGYTIEVEQVSI